MTPEGKVKAQIKDKLLQHGAYFFMPVQTGYGSRGLDIYCCLYGRFIGIETKAGTKKATQAQEYVMRKIRDAGGIAIEAHSWEEVYNELYHVDWPTFANLIR